MEINLISFSPYKPKQIPYNTFSPSDYAIDYF